ncbi:MAG: phage tail protein [Terracidiphilus sp.]
MADKSREPRPRLIDLLPAIYQDQGIDGRPNYLFRLLSALERILWGVEEQTRAKKDSGSSEGLRDKVDQLNQLLDPRQAPEEFLPWLAGWVALTLRSNMRQERKRELIANMIPLYRIRGTSKYVNELLRLCVDVPAAVEEEDIPPLQLGVHSTLGRDTYVGGGAPHHFRVRMMATHLSVPELEEQRQLAYEVVELAKPAHTSYDFWIDSPQMQIGVHSTLGIDTVLGPAQAA